MMLVIQLIYQQVENYIVYPIVYRRAVELSPFTTIVAVLIAGSLLGVVGAILAVPFAAVIKIVLREAGSPRRQRMALLRETPQPEPPPPEPDLRRAGDRGARAARVRPTQSSSVSPGSSSATSVRGRELGRTWPAKAGPGIAQSAVAARVARAAGTSPSGSAPRCAARAARPPARRLADRDARARATCPSPRSGTSATSSGPACRPCRRRGPCRPRSRSARPRSTTKPSAGDLRVERAAAAVVHGGHGRDRPVAQRDRLARPAPRRPRAPPSLRSTRRRRRRARGPARPAAAAATGRRRGRGAGGRSARRRAARRVGRRRVPPQVRHAAAAAAGR